MSIKPIVAVFGLLAASPAMAEVVSFKAAPAKVVETKTYYQTTGTKFCEEVDSCVLNFPKIGNGDAVIFRRVSCLAQHATPITLAAFGIGVKKGDAQLNPLVTLTLPGSVPVQDARLSSINQEVLLRISNGDLPTIGVATTGIGSIFLNCTATGEPD